MVSASSLPPGVNRLAARLLPALPGLVTLLFALLTAALVARLVWLLVPVPEAGQWRPAPVTPPPQTRSPASRDPVATIASAQLFGQFRPPEQAAPQQTVEEAPETTLNLSLLGILADEDENISRALIGAPGKEEEAYAVGDDVARGVTIHAIHADRVILRRAGLFETLRLDKDRQSSGGVAASPRAAPGRIAATPDVAERLGEIRQELLENPAKASTYLRVQPAMSNGELRGYRLYPGRERSVFTEVGLRPGDLVTAINGVQLDDPAQALQMLSDLSSARDLSLVIERGGEAQTINLSLN